MKAIILKLRRTGSREHIRKLYSRKESKEIKESDKDKKCIE